MTAPLAVDVLIVGAGPAGAVAACVLAPRHSVVLVDRCAAPPFRIGESLVGAARPLLRDLGLLGRFEAAGHRPSLGQTSSWGSGELAQRDSFLDPHGPGWRIARVQFETMLREAASERGATLIAPGEVSRVTHSAGASGWTAVIRSAEGVRSIAARFMIDATGRSASFARANDASLRACDRLVCRFVRLPPPTTPDHFERVSLVEAVTDGWWYGATLPDGSRVAAFHTDADLPAARQSREPAGFFELLGATRWMSSATAISDRRDWAVERVSARSQWLAAPCGADWCAVGDAAVAFDPLSSQGLFNALYTGLRGAEAVAGVLDGDAAPLEAYRDRLAKVRKAYRRNLAGYYGLETRFADRVFWRRRILSGA